VLAVVRGTAYALYFRITSRGSVVIRFPFLAYERVSISGPGRVEIGPYCSVYPNVFRGLNLVTLTPSARVTIGRGCSLGGLTIRAARGVAIGERTRTAYSLVQDTLFCANGAVKSANGHRDLVAPIVIGRNVWLASASCVLSGTSIGDDSVVSQGACTVGAKVGALALAAGNLHERTLPIRGLMRLRGSA
jgi:acetyltransferase-like isoleucine patch superfamily enzyme